MSAENKAMVRRLMEAINDGGCAGRRFLLALLQTLRGTEPIQGGV